MQSVTFKTVKTSLTTMCLFIGNCILESCWQWLHLNRNVNRKYHKGFNRTIRLSHRNTECLTSPKFWLLSDNPVKITSDKLYLANSFYEWECRTINLSTTSVETEMSQVDGPWFPLTLTWVVLVVTHVTAMSAGLLWNSRWLSCSSRPAKKVKEHLCNSVSKLSAQYFGQ